MDATKPGSIAKAESPADTAREESSEVTLLIERAKNGDADAFGDLMRLYERRVIGIGVQMGLSRDDALDACQDTFIKVFRYIHRFRSGESFFKWLYRIALNSVHDHKRRSRQPGRVSLDDLDREQTRQLEDRSPQFAARIDSANLANRLLAELSCLSRRERIVFVLRDFQEMSTSEIGKILGVAQVTVRRHCMSARQKLRERLFPRGH